ncbi:hypothetical protein EVAR_99568_1 [Eumeta japonica]|uniref:Uncharacterized protein n=1 Tax=Eumeta variegata TaxID=151549 RepID=A0A4C1YWY8_EUMVA|nr:hypothetical protein EVAR_99568_1 [Eumeta japonica]
MNKSKAIGTHSPRRRRISADSRASVTAVSQRTLVRAEHAGKSAKKNVARRRGVENTEKKVLRGTVFMRSGNFDVKDEPRSGRPVTDKVNVILKEVKQVQHINSYRIAEELEIEQFLTI